MRSSPSGNDDRFFGTLFSRKRKRKSFNGGGVFDTRYSIFSSDNSDGNTIFGFVTVNAEYFRSHPLLGQLYPDGDSNDLIKKLIIKYKLRIDSSNKKIFSDYHPARQLNGLLCLTFIHPESLIQFREIVVKVNDHSSNSLNSILTSFATSFTYLLPISVTLGH